jgi:hypothetical protein
VIFLLFHYKLCFVNIRLDFLKSQAYEMAKFIRVAVFHLVNTFLKFNKNTPGDLSPRPVLSRVGTS